MTTRAPAGVSLFNRDGSITLTANGEISATGGGGGGGPTSGDVNGTLPGPYTVVGLQGVDVDPTAPSAGDALIFDGTAWAATPLPPGGPFAVTGDVTGSVPGALTVVRLQGRALSAAAPAPGDVIAWDGANWEPTAFAAAGVEPATPATIPLRTAAGGLRANALTADVGDLTVGHTSATPAAPGDGDSTVVSANSANTAGNGGEVVLVGGDAASPDATPRIGGGILMILGTSAGVSPIGATWRVLTSTGALVIAGGVRGVGTAVQSQDVIVGNDVVPEVANTGNIGGPDLRFLSVNATSLVARADSTDVQKATLTATALTVLAAAGTPGPFTLSARDTLYEGQQRGQVTTVPFASPTTTIDLDTGSIFEVTLAGDTTIAFSNLRTGARWTVELIQDATGNRQATWTGVTMPNYGTPPVLSRSVASRDTFRFYFDGTNVLLESFIILEGTPLGYQSRALASGESATARVNDYLRQPGTATATITLPSAIGLSPNHSVNWKEIAGGTSAITFDVAGGGTIDGAATYVSTAARAGLTFVAAGNGTNIWDAYPQA